MFNFTLKVIYGIYIAILWIYDSIKHVMYYIASNLEYKKYLFKLLLKNLLFMFMIAAVVFVYFSKKINDQMRKRLLVVKLLLFMTYLFLTFTSSREQSSFIENKIPFVDISRILDDKKDLIQIKDSMNKLIPLETELKHEKGLKIYYNTCIDDLRLIIFSILRNSNSRVVNLSYRYQPDDWKENYPYILQAIKNDLLYYADFKYVTIVFDNIPLELLRYDFLDLLIMFENHFDNMKFIVLENKSDNIQLIRFRYDYLDVYEVKELDPEIFKTMLIRMILQSRSNRMTDIQAARIAHEIYMTKGASIHELSKLHKKYYNN